MNKHIGDVTAFGDAATVDYCNAIAYLLYYSHLMCDDDDGNSCLAVDVLNKLQNAVRRCRVESTCRFIAKNDFRVACKRTGYCNTLFLTARKLCGI